MTKQSRVTRLGSLEQLWADLRAPGFVEFTSDPGSDPVAINVQTVTRVEPRGGGGSTVHTLDASTNVQEAYAVALASVTAVAAIKENRGIEDT